VMDGLAVVALWWAFVTIGRGEYLTTVVVLGYVVSAVAFTLALTLIMLGKVSPRARIEAGRTTVRPDRWVDGSFIAINVAGFIALATFAIFYPMGRIDITLPPGNHQYIVIMATAGALFGIPNVWLMFKRGGVSFQKLTSGGFELGQGLSSVRGEWDDVVAISDRRPGKEPPFRATLFVKFKDGKIRTQAIDSYTPGGDALRRFVRYYWANPDARGELTDGRAVARLSDYTS
jgi:hypothetical protein